jgi:hypothetical protein
LYIYRQEITVEGGDSVVRQSVGNDFIIGYKS